MKGYVLFLLLTLLPAWSADALRDHLLVVYNPSAGSSEALAREYAERRQIPSERVIALKCPDREEITRQEFNEHLLKPLETLLMERGWLQQIEEKIQHDGQTFSIRKAIRNEIWCILLMRGMPLKIAPDLSLVDAKPLQDALRTNAASVDSELALLPLSGVPRCGLIPNPYYTRDRPHRFDTLDALDMILVGRLDAPTPEDVRRMIEDAIWTETHGLVGRAQMDVRGITDPQDPYHRGDEWIETSAKLLEAQGWPVEVETSAGLFLPKLPWADIAWYLGWYAEHAQGPFMTQPVFSRGAIAYHIHSFSAATIRSESQHWVGPLLHAGATATMGCVYEPYLDLTPQIDLFTHSLIEGYTLVEAGYRSQRALSWMNVVVGDPLYRPFARPLSELLSFAKDNHPYAFPWLSMRHRLTPREGADRGNALLPLLSEEKATGIELELSGDWWIRQPSSFTQAAKAYDLASGRTTRPVDRIRVGLKSARSSAIRGKWEDSFKLLQSLSRELPKEFVRWGGVDAVHWIASRPEAPGLPPSLRPYLEKKETW